MARARFSGKKGSFEPSCEVNRKMLKSGMDPAILLHRYKSGFGAEEHEQSHPYRKMCRTLRQFLLV